MPTVRFTRNIQRHVECPEREIAGATVRAVLNGYFALHPAARGYVLDDMDRLRPHMAIFVNGNQIQDRDHLADPVVEGAALDIIQSLSGGLF